MDFHFRKKDYYIIILCSLVVGLIVYFALSSLYVDAKISVPLSISLSILVFGLSKYYNLQISSNKAQYRVPNSDNNVPHDTISTQRKDGRGQASLIFFIVLFVVLVLISSLSDTHDFHVFTNWNAIGITGVIQLGSAILLCFFIPGYAIVLIITKNYKIDPILSVLLAYLFSMIITGLTAYISALSFDQAVSQSKFLLIQVYLVILASFIIYYSRHIIKSESALPAHVYYSGFIKNMTNELTEYARTRSPELLVFGSLFAVLIISTYLLYGGVTIGDQWYHQGRALLFMYGSIREAVLSGADGSYYPPFQSAILAALSTLSGIPLVNSYASIAFLNAIPMFAFYYFFTSWVPSSIRKAAPLAVSLFMLSSGFGWIYLFVTTNGNMLLSPQTIVTTLRSIGHLDIVSMSNFVLATAPEFSTALIYIALPAGFVILAMLRTRFDPRPVLSISVVTAITVLGIISHYEFYLFIIIAAIAIPIFRIKSKSFVYIAFIISISIVYILNKTVPGSFYTSVQILGFPLLNISAFFVMITWAIYLAQGHEHKYLRIRLPISNPIKIIYRSVRFNFVSVSIIVFLVAYLYLLCFIVLNQLSLDTTRDQSALGVVPWYLYPMKLGVVGLIGLTFALSYIFKKFEKELFIFAIIIIVSLIISPYYIENRFSKYVMVGFIGFTSVFIYKILNIRLGNIRISSTILIAIIIPSSALSTLIFIGYNSLIFQTQDYIDTLPRRHFPSLSELSLFETLRNKVNIDSNQYNAISFSNEYDTRNDGIMTKVPSFSPLPYDKSRQSPLILNASTIEEFYKQLDYSDTRYIIVPKHDYQYDNMITQPTRFAVDFFKHIYEDNDYILLEVPRLYGPNESSNETVVLVYSDKPSPSGNSNVTVVPYDNKTFNLRTKDDSVRMLINNQTEGIILGNSNDEKETTLWSKNFTQSTNTNSMQASFRISPQNVSQVNNHTGLKWIEGGTQYYVKLSKNGLELYQKPKGEQFSKILARNTEIKNEDSVWYTLTIETTNNLTKIYVNNMPKIEVSKTTSGNSGENHGISRIGLVTSQDKVEFKPIKMWNLSLPNDEYPNFKYYNYYFPLNILALSQSNYDSAQVNDLSVFSKKEIIIPDTLKIDNYTLTKYLEYVRNGGSLIAINPSDTFNGTFSRYFSIESDESNARIFDKISSSDDHNDSINVHGLVKNIISKHTPDEKIIASYINKNNQTVAPFAIKKSFSNGGSITLINAKGYFNAISNSPKQNFESLSNVLKLLAFDHGVTKAFPSKTSIPTKGFIGDFDLLGKVTVNSSSLSFLDEGSFANILNAKSIRIYNGTDKIQNTLFDDASIKSIKLVGDYKAITNLNGSLELPGMFSDRSYISMSIHDDFNMTVRLSPEKLSYMELMIGNQTFGKLFKITNGSKIEFYHMRAAPQLKSLNVLVKNPEITVNGRAIAKNENFDGFLTLRGSVSRGTPFDFHGGLKTKFGFVDHYLQPYRQGISTRYITYLQSLTANGSLVQLEGSLKIPGDISSNAKMKGEYIPLEKILSSPTNIIAMIFLIPATIISVWFFRRVGVF